MTPTRRIVLIVGGVLALLVIGVIVSLVLINVGGGHGIATVNTITRTTTP